jgi:tRNA threonylcarbamoyladenosine biosynthesis protein TsaE
MGRSERIFFTSSAEETLQLGKEIGQTLEPRSTVAFFGEFGAGKTTFIKGLAAGAAHLSPHQINSPTFTYLNIYTGAQTIYHFDLYRLKDSQSFYQLGFEEYFEAEGICLIEWSERISSALPNKRIEISIEHMGEDKRRIIVGNHE